MENVPLVLVTASVVRGWSRCSSRSRLRRESRRRGVDNDARQCCGRGALSKRQGRKYGDERAAEKQSLHSTSHPSSKKQRGQPRK